MAPLRHRFGSTFFLSVILILRYSGHVIVKLFPWHTAFDGMFQGYTVLCVRDCIVMKKSSLNSCILPL